MYPDIATRVTLYEGLRLIDADLEARAIEEGCPHCGGPLDRSPWKRKPGGLKPEPKEVFKRLGLCCRACRKRVLPGSALFLGRKVFFAAIVMLTVAVRQRRTTGCTMRRLRDLFGVSLRTIRRWISFFQVDFPVSPLWKRLRGRVSALVRDDRLPDALLAQFDQVFGCGERAITACLAFCAGGK